ncbi:hypothetical protein PUN28_006966 [Cardiocondyla obscurior]|uniref:Uncharacterized protein n=1 Tax=Cardiocondyla obscurior TaxID=286306 RepID=A0AAW2G336_9HYME
MSQVSSRKGNQSLKLDSLEKKKEKKMKKKKKTSSDIRYLEHVRETIKVFNKTREQRISFSNYFVRSGRARLTPFLHRSSSSSLLPLCTLPAISFHGSLTAYASSLTKSPFRKLLAITNVTST